MRINGRASMLNDAEAKARYFGAQLMVRIECEIYPNCPRYVPDLAGEDLSPYVRAGNTTAARVEEPLLCPRHSASGDPHAEVAKANTRDS